MDADHEPSSDFKWTFWQSSSVLPFQSADLIPEHIDDSEFRLLADAIPTLCWIANGDGYIVWYNRRWHEYCGTTAEEMEGWGWQSVHDPDLLPQVMERWTRSIATGEPFEMTFPLRGADGRFRPFLTRVQPVSDVSGQVVRWIGVNTEISAQLAAEAARRDEEMRFKTVFENAAVGMLEIDSKWHIIGANAAYSQITGYPLDELIGKSSLGFTHPDDIAASEAALRQTAFDGLPQASVEKRYIRADGSQVYVRSYVSKVSGEGDNARFLKVVENISEMRAAQDALEAESRLLQTLNRTGSSLAAELELERVVQMVTDAGVELTGAQFGAFFYNVIDRAGERLLLYTLSGADRADFETFGMPRATPIFKPTFVGEGTVRSDDITKDPRYGKNAPHKGMPKGHLPVRSYLAVPVIGRDGEVIGGLFFGHPEPGKFNSRHEELMVGIAAQAAVAIDNARLYRALKELNETLEDRVNEEMRRRNEAEDALRQAQKMEAVGQLTGGIAHDFNNLLQIVSGNLEILRTKITDESSQLRRYADRAMLGAERAATLTQRLLAFSRRQPLAPKPIDVNRLVSGMSELLHRTLGETVEVEAVMAPRLWPVEVDPNQLETAIINLAVNARDAMPDGGKLTIETANTSLDRDYAAQNPEVGEGQYVVICISDTGTGMDPDVAARAIEPFYTTKEVGKGTGLGLSMVYGFVKQSGGHLKIYSEDGEGTTVKIYLPRLLGEVPVTDAKEDSDAPTGSSEETILVCEDDEDVRAYTVEVLRDLNYKVLEAGDGEQALQLVREQGGKIDLLFTDVVLPGKMTGAVLAREAVAIQPHLKTLFTTGYARNAIVHQGRLDPGVELLTKPFSYSDLAARVRDLLDK
jgi:PAS domain S-box-containing protein